MTGFVELSLHNQISLLKQAKTKKNCSWQALAKILGVNRSMIFLYLSGSRLPLVSFLKLCKLADIRPDKFSFNKIVLPREKSITKPAMEPEFANFLGILAGDGHMNLISYEVTITGHKKLDKQFIEQHVMPMFENLFGLKPHERFDKHRMICRVYSKKLVEYLIGTFDLPAGKKTNRLRIPKQVFDNNGLLKAYIRGLFDTDGSVYPHHKNSIALDITSRDPAFREDVLRGLRKLSFHPTMNGKNIQLYRKHEIDEFFKGIKPKNARHLKRYQTYKKMGRLPSAKEITRS